ncbi:MAG: DUF2953 domain-containing protein [Dorea sp.]
MLHILLLILKIIGIVIAVVLGILVLLVCIVLFVPVRYRADASCEGRADTIRAAGKVTWLLHLIRADVSYSEKKLNWRIRIAWKVLKNEQEDSVTIEEEVEEDEEELAKELAEKIEKEMETDQKSLEEKKEEPAEEKRLEKDDGCSKSIPQKAEEKSGLSERTERKGCASDPKKKTLIQRLRDKIKGIFRKIKCTIQKICDKMKLLSEKKNKITEALTDEVHQKAFRKVKKEAFKLLRRWKPKRVHADIHYGFEDPCMTGQVLAALSVIYPFIGDHLRVQPDFEQKILEGFAEVRGGIRLISAVCLLWNLLWCREVRKTYHDIRNFEL